MTFAYDFAGSLQRRFAFARRCWSRNASQFSQFHVGIFIQLIVGFVHFLLRGLSLFPHHGIFRPVLWLLPRVLKRLPLPLLYVLESTIRRIKCVDGILLRLPSLP